MQYSEVVEAMCSVGEVALEVSFVSGRVRLVLLWRAHGRGALASSMSPVLAVDRLSCSSLEWQQPRRRLSCDLLVMKEVNRDVEKSPRGASRLTIGHAWGVSPGQSRRMLMPAAIMVDQPKLQDGTGVLRGNDQRFCRLGLISC